MYRIPPAPRLHPPPPLTTTTFLRPRNSSRRSYVSLPPPRVPVKAGKMRKRNMERIALEDLGVGGGGFVGLAPMLKEGEDRILGRGRIRNLPNIGDVWETPSSSSTATTTTTTTTTTIATMPTRRKKVLEQGLLQPLEPPAEPLEPISDRSYPPVIRQVLEHMATLGPEVILFTRVGGFYELYFSHAEQWAGRMDLKLAAKKTQAGTVPMAGFPFWQLEKYLKILVEDEGCYVAICEEYPREHPQDGDVALEAERGAFERRIARVVTPGTLIDEEWIEQGENHFLLAVERVGEELGLAWADIGTGEVFVTACGAEQLAAEIARIAPREIVCTDQERASLLKLRERAAWVVSSHEMQGLGRVAEVLDTTEDAEKLHALKTLELLAAERLLDYVGSRMPGIEVKMQAPVRRDSNEVMGIDVNSMRGLEIKNTLRDGGAKGSLLHTVNRTVTRGGRRLLGNWLTNPSTDVDVIERRLDLVETFLNDEPLREDIVAFLKRTHDSQRIVQKISMGRGDPDDMVALAKTIVVTNEILERLREANHKVFAPVVARVNSPTELAERILNAIDEEGLMRHQIEAADVAATVSEPPTPQDVTEANKAAEELFEEVVEAGAGRKKNRKKRISQGIENSLNRAMMSESDSDDAWIMKKSASSLLRELHARLEALREAKGHLEVHLRNKLNAQSLTLKWSPLLGHFCHVKGKDVHIPGIISVSASRTTRSFLHPEWTRLGESINNVRLRIRTEEKAVFNSLLKDVRASVQSLRNNAAVLDELDIAAGFAALAKEQNLVRPKLTRGTTHKIVGGRHITVEAGLREQGAQFVGNDCFVGDKETLWLVTGPNMAGKSTFLRQNALISILAQTGSYVPAIFASLGIVDKIFSRIGSADNLFNSQSTFMVEMLETATILRSATPRSFVIMDEIGRGTAPRDGTAVAAAVLKHLVERAKCRTLFATHFHELADLVGEDHRVATWCSDVRETRDGGWAFVHKLRRGVNRESHALRVARMAGMPQEVLRDAEELLKQEEKKMKEGREQLRMGLATLESIKRYEEELQEELERWGLKRDIAEMEQTEMRKAQRWLKRMENAQKRAVKERVEKEEEAAADATALEAAVAAAAEADIQEAEMKQMKKAEKRAEKEKVKKRKVAAIPEAVVTEAEVRTTIDAGDALEAAAAAAADIQEAEKMKQVEKAENERHTMEKAAAVSKTQPVAESDEVAAAAAAIPEEAVVTEAEVRTTIDAADATALEAAVAAEQEKADQDKAATEKAAAASKTQPVADDVPAAAAAALEAAAVATEAEVRTTIDAADALEAAAAATAADIQEAEKMKQVEKAENERHTMEKAAAVSKTQPVAESDEVAAAAAAIPEEAVVTEAEVRTTLDAADATALAAAVAAEQEKAAAQDIAATEKAAASKPQPVTESDDVPAAAAAILEAAAAATEVEVGATIDTAAADIQEASLSASEPSADQKPKKPRIKILERQKRDLELEERGEALEILRAAREKEEEKMVVVAKERRRSSRRVEVVEVVEELEDTEERVNA